jgi:hypothetical protein
MNDHTGWNNTLEASDLQNVFVEKHDDLEHLSPPPLMRRKFDYYAPV